MLLIQKRGLQMETKTDAQVQIGGRVLTLTGYETEEYMQRVAAYINGKMLEYSQIDSFRRQSTDTQNILLQLNIADDYFKLKRQLDILQEDVDKKDRELYDVKHDLITAQIKLKSLEETLSELQEDNIEKDKTIVRLETELSSMDPYRRRVSDEEEEDEDTGKMGNINSLAAMVGDEAEDGEEMGRPTFQQRGRRTRKRR